MTISPRLVGCITLVVSCTNLGTTRELDGFEKIFNGRSLAGWHALPAQNVSDWSVKDGVLVGRGSEDRLVYLMFDEPLENFELKLRYRLPGRGNTGVEIRSRKDPSGKRPVEGYHADLGHVGIGPHILGAWDFHFAKREEYACPRGTRLQIDAQGKTTTEKIKRAVQLSDIKKSDWNELHVVARGEFCSFKINGKLASEFTDELPQRLRKGWIGLQIHDAGMTVEFKDIYLKRLPSEMPDEKRQ